MQHLDLPAPTAASQHTIFGLGSLWSVANVAVTNASLISLVGPILLGLAALWQAKTARDRLLFERERDRRERDRERDTLRPTPVLASPTVPAPSVTAPSS